MSILFWRRYWNRARARAEGARARKPHTRKPFLEVLEDRTLFDANMYTVTLPGDAGAADPTDPSGLSGDIRYVINQADQPFNANSTIHFDTARIGVPVIALTSGLGELRILQDMTIAGPGATTLTINGTGSSAGPSRVFEINSGITVSISGLTIAGGNASPFSSTAPGNQGGDIFNGGTLTLTNDVVRDGLAQGGEGPTASAVASSTRPTPP
jgi:hypothetical protein